MACGKPVICTQLNNGVNVVNQEGITGLAVPVRDISALSNAINHLIKDQGLRCAMGKQAKLHAVNEYSNVAMTDQHLKLYHTLLLNTS